MSFFQCVLPFLATPYQRPQHRAEGFSPSPVSVDREGSVLEWL